MAANLAAIDLIDGATFERDAQGLHTTRVAIVTGLVGPAAYRMVEALSGRFGLPEYGSKHPYADIYVTKITADAIDSDVVRVTFAYGVPDVSGGGQLPPDVGEPPQLTVGSTLQTVQTNLDHQGNLIKVRYTHPLAAGAQGPPSVEDIPVTVDLQVPMTTVDFARREDRTPLDKSRRFVGRINSEAIEGFLPHTILCTAIVGTTRDGGVTYDVRYEFQIADVSWDITAVAIDPNTGQPFKDVSASNGIEVKQIYKDDDFNLLDLRLPPIKIPGQIGSP